jgi:endoglucanase Acf2
MSISFTDLIKISNNESIVRYNATLTDGRSFFAYIKCNSTGAKLMFQDYETLTKRSITEYGEVIYTDFLSEPDEKAKSFLENWIKENN